MAVTTKTLAIIFGVVLVVVGILGFVPGVVANGLLLHVFAIDFLHNIIHIFSGVVALGVGLLDTRYAQRFFQIFGVFYTIVMIGGFIEGTTVFGLISINMADQILHLIIAASALWIGFVMNDTTRPAEPTA